MKRLHLPPQRRDRIAAIALLVLLLISLPLLGSLLENWLVPKPQPQAALAATSTATATILPTVVALSPSVTTTVTPNPTATPALTATHTPEPTRVPTATPLPRVYLIPFRQVFAVGLAQPFTGTPVLFYENSSDIFQLLERSGPYARLQTLDGRMNFWTAVESISDKPPAAPQYDFSVRGKLAHLENAQGLACLHDSNLVPPLSVCQPLADFKNANITARIISSGNLIYLGEIRGKSYFIVAGDGFFLS